jgi:hypothetical protein
MILKIFVHDSYQQLKSEYVKKIIERNNELFNYPQLINVGVDLYTPNKIECLLGEVITIDYNILCSARILTDNLKEYNTGFYIYPKMGLNKTPLRIINSIQIIEPSYRENIYASFDIVKNYEIEENQPLIHICSHGLCPIIPYIVNTKEELDT